MSPFYRQRTGPWLREGGWVRICTQAREPRQPEEALTSQAPETIIPSGTGQMPTPPSSIQRLPRGHPSACLPRASKADSYSGHRFIPRDQRGVGPGEMAFWIGDNTWARLCDCRNSGRISLPPFSPVTRLNPPLPYRAVLWESSGIMFVKHLPQGWHIWLS